MEHSNKIIIFKVIIPFYRPKVKQSCHVFERNVFLKSMEFTFKKRVNLISASPEYLFRHQTSDSKGMNITVVILDHRKYHNYQ